MIKKARILIFLILCSFVLQAQNDIDSIIKIKEKDKTQQSILIIFKEKFQKEDRISVEEFDIYYELIVSHPSSDGFTGGAEGYKLDKKTGESEMTWHEHPMPLPEIDYNENNLLDTIKIKLQ